MLPSTKKQRQLIGIGCTQLGINKPLKADMLLERFGKSSTRDISKQQADKFLKELISKGFCIVSRKPSRQRSAIPRGSKTVHAMVSQRELYKITAVSRLIDWRVENGMALWMKKRFKIDTVRTSDDAYLVIEGLKKMFENAMKKAHGDRWWVAVYDDPGIEVYIIEHCPVRFRREVLLARRQQTLKVVK